MSLASAAVLALHLSQALAPGQVDAVQEPQPAAKRDRYLVKVGAASTGAAAEGPRAGRLLVFFLPDQKRWSASDPADAPVDAAPTLTRYRSRLATGCGS
jgi:hypothetical protein